jgi:hypothetical protein
LVDAPNWTALRYLPPLPPPALPPPPPAPPPPPPPVPQQGSGPADRGRVLALKQIPTIKIVKNIRSMKVSFV